MTPREVHWHEGMFLRPQHFQSLARHVFDRIGRQEQWDQPFHWGLRSLDLDLDALANFSFRVRELEARWRDGTTIKVPEDANLPEVDLKGPLAEAKSVDILLAVPRMQSGRPNVGAAGAPQRYTVDALDFEDENTGVGPQRVQVRRLNATLLPSTQDAAGFEVLPLARVVKSSRAEATPELDRSYIPPVIAVDAWKPLVAEILQAVHDRLGKKMEVLAQQVLSRGIGFGSRAPADALIFEQLCRLNEAYSLFGIQFFTPRLHPYPAYCELARLVGHLAIFGPTRRPVELPHYDHDDLGRCFYEVKRRIDELLDVMVEPEYKERPFVGAGSRMQVALEPAWLESVWQMFIGVRSELPVEECVELLTRPGRLDAKIGSADRVDAIFRMGLPGLRFAHAPLPPRALPSQSGLIYFQVDRAAPGAGDSEWQNVEASLTLAIRLNENLIAGSIQGQRTLRIRTGSETTTLEFTLYVVPRGSA